MMGGGRGRGPMGHGPMAMMKGEKARDFKGTMRKLIQYLGSYTIPILIVMVFAVGSTVFSIAGPKILGKATTRLFEGVMGQIAGTGAGIDFDYIGRILLITLALYLGSALFGYVQGWVMHDRFLLRGVFGIVYEFLWANPYQPGLSYYHLPLLFHDPRSGQLFVRSNWDDDATWFGLFQNQMQVFEDGQIHVLDRRNKREPLTLGNVTLVFSQRFNQSLQPSGKFFVVGLKPRTTYNLEVDYEELRERRTDAAGVLALAFPPEGKAEVRITEPETRGSTLKHGSSK